MSSAAVAVSSFQVPMPTWGICWPVLSLMVGGAML